MVSQIFFLMKKILFLPENYSAQFLLVGKMAIDKRLTPYLRDSIVTLHKNSLNIVDILIRIQ